MFFAFGLAYLEFLLLILDAVQLESLLPPRSFLDTSSVRHPQSIAGAPTPQRDSFGVVVEERGVDTVQDYRDNPGVFDDPEFLDRLGEPNEYVNTRTTTTLPPVPGVGPGERGALVVRVIILGFSKGCEEGRQLRLPCNKPLFTVKFVCVFKPV